MQKRRVYIDSNIWNFLFDRDLDLSTALPNSEFDLCITPEVEYEIRPIPAAKAELKSFIEATIARSSVRTVAYFGFYDDRFARDEQRVGGFGDGSEWITCEERDYLAQKNNELGERARRKPGLVVGKREADTSLVARSFHSFLLTLDEKRDFKTLPSDDCKVIYLAGFDDSGNTLKDYIAQKIEEIERR